MALVRLPRDEYQSFAFRFRATEAYRPEARKILAAATELLLTEGFTLHATRRGHACRDPAEPPYLLFSDPQRPAALPPRNMASKRCWRRSARWSQPSGSHRDPQGRTDRRTVSTTIDAGEDRPSVVPAAGRLLVASDEDPASVNGCREFDARVISILGAGFAARSGRQSVPSSCIFCVVPLPARCISTYRRRPMSHFSAWCAPSKWRSMPS